MAKKQKKTEHVPYASRTEWIKLAVLVILALGIGFYLLYNLENMKVEESDVIRQETSDIIFAEDEDLISFNSSQIKPFVEDSGTLENITDDKHLRTEGFYYLLHRITQLSDEKITEKVNYKLGWKDLVKPESRDKLRGEFMRVRGGIVELKREILEGEIAESRGLNGMAVWKGAIYSSDGRLYLFAITDFPENLRKGDGVELKGAFYKVWIYQSQTGREAYNPFFIGKTLRILPPIDPKGPKKFHIVFLTIFAITCIFLGYAIFTEKKEAKKFWETQMQRKLQKKKKDLSKIKDNQKGNPEGSDEKSPESDEKSPESDEKSLESDEKPFD